MIAKGSDSATLEEVRNKYSDYEIAHKYLGITCIPEVINSPIRQDKSPSLGLFEGSIDKGILYRDFGTGDTGTLFDLLSKIWNIPLHSTYRRILEDTVLEDVPKNRSRIKVYRKTTGKIEVRVREWRKYDLDYWKSYGIELPWLKFGDIYPISHIIITKKDTPYAISADKYAYAYVERKDGIVSFKIYQPFSKDFKWISKHDSSVWDLWTKIPEKGDCLIITSSRKDALCIWSNTGIPSLSLQGEGYIPKEHVVQQLKDRFKNIYVLYDNDFQSEDNHGREYGRTISESFGLIQIEIPEEYKSKDPSDLVKNHGTETLKKVIYQLISQTN